MQRVKVSKKTKSDAPFSESVGWSGSALLACSGGHSQPHHHIAILAVCNPLSDIKLAGLQIIALYGFVH